MDKEERRKAGAHYTTEKNILKVIGPLFLDDLRAEFDTMKARKQNRVKLLRAFHDSLADLYDPDIMPADLRRAHQANDRAVDRLYRKAAFKSERDRVEHLFQLYEKMTNPLLAKPAKKRRRKRAS